MAKYSVCIYCGDNLDHGERCECQNKIDLEKSEYERMELSHEEKKEPEFMYKKFQYKKG